MNLRFFKGNGVAMTLAPLDIRLSCFARPVPHNTMCKTWNSSISNWATLHLWANEPWKNTCMFFFKSSHPWHPLPLGTFTYPIFFQSPYNLLPTSPPSLLILIIRLMQAFKLWYCVFALETSCCFFANFVFVSMRLDFSSSNCLFMSRKFEESLMASF